MCGPNGKAIGCSNASYKAFRHVGTLFIQGVCFCCTGQVLVGATPSLKTRLLCTIKTNALDEQSFYMSGRPYRLVVEIWVGVNDSRVFVTKLPCL